MNIFPGWNRARPRRTACWGAQVVNLEKFYTFAHLREEAHQHSARNCKTSNNRFRMIQLLSLFFSFFSSIRCRRYIFFPISTHDFDALRCVLGKFLGTAEHRSNVHGEVCFICLEQSLRKEEKKSYRRRTLICISLGLCRWALIGMVGWRGMIFYLHCQRWII